MSGALDSRVGSVGLACRERATRGVGVLDSRVSWGFPIGIAPRWEVVYRALLDRYRWRVGELAVVLGWSVGEVGEVVGRLRGEGLVVASADDAQAVRAVEPRLALPALTVRRLRSSDEPLPAAVEVERFIAVHECPFCRTRGRTSDGHDAVSVLVERMVAGVQREVLMLVPDYVPGKAEFAPHIAETALRRGAAPMAVWGTTFLHLPEVAEYARWLGARRATPRTAARVPARVVIVDRTVGVVTDDGPRARVMRPGPLLDTYTRLAIRLWDRAVEVRAGRQPVPEPDGRPRGELVLQLLADGLTDDAIARRIGVSVRTVRTEVASLMSNLDARSRFQAGLRAAQLGLL
jgi:DNA-binding CsgD family transcriptional regulator